MHLVHSVHLIHPTHFPHSNIFRFQTNVFLSFSFLFFDSFTALCSALLCSALFYSTLLYSTLLFSTPLLSFLYFLHRYSKWREETTPKRRTYHHTTGRMGQQRQPKQHQPEGNVRKAAPPPEEGGGERITTPMVVVTHRAEQGHFPGTRRWPSSFSTSPFLRSICPNSATSGLFILCGCFPIFYMKLLT